MCTEQAGCTAQNQETWPLPQGAYMVVLQTVPAGVPTVFSVGLQRPVTALRTDPGPLPPLPPESRLSGWRMKGEGVLCE